MFCSALEGAGRGGGCVDGVGGKNGGLGWTLGWVGWCILWQEYAVGGDTKKRTIRHDRKVSVTNSFYDYVDIRCNYLCDTITTASYSFHKIKLSHHQPTSNSCTLLPTTLSIPPFQYTQNTPYLDIPLPSISQHDHLYVLTTLHLNTPLHQYPIHPSIHLQPSHKPWIQSLPTNAINTKHIQNAHLLPTPTTRIQC